MRGCRLVLLVLASLSAVACGRFGDPDDVAGPPGSGVGDTSVFEQVTTTATDVTTGSGPTSTVGPPAPSPSPPSTVAVNRADRSQAGWAVTLVVGERAGYATTDEFPVEVTVRNDTGARGYALLGQDAPAVFLDPVSREVVWSAHGCNDTLAVPELEGGTRIVEPAEELRVVTHYPLSERCVVAAGRYEAYGQFEICPPDRVEETQNPGTYRCPEGAAVAVWAGPVGFTLT